MDEDDYRHIRYLARSYVKKCERLTEDDLFQVGVIGYLRYIKNYNPEKGKKWDYMWLAVAGVITDYIGRQDGLIYIPQHARKYVAYEYEDLDNYDILCIDKDLDDIEGYYKRDICERCMERLTVKQKDVISELYGLTDGQPKTLEQVGNKYNVTRERVRQIAARALRLMRYEIRNENAEDLIE